MTGPWHYQRAERYLSRATRHLGPDSPTPVNPQEAAHCLALAQAHATLALVAAVAANEETEGWVAALTDKTSGSSS